MQTRKSEKRGGGDEPLDSGWLLPDTRLMADAVARDSALHDLPSQQDYADADKIIAALRISAKAGAEQAAQRASSAAAKAAKAAADKAAVEKAAIQKNLAAEKAASEKLSAELEVAREQAEKAKAETIALKQQAAESVAAAQIAAEKAAVERAAAQRAFANPAPAPISMVSSQVDVSVRKLIPNSLYIPHFPPGWTKDELKARFVTYGRVIACKVLPHKGGKYAFVPYKGGKYAFVDYESEIAAQKALAATITVDGVKLVVLPKTVAVEPPNKFVAAVAIAAVPGSGAAGGGNKSAQQGGYVPMPFPAPDNAKNFDAHAEVIAVAYMRRALGFADAAINGGIHTNDGGVDVVSSRAVAQVKANFRSGAIKRGPITQLIGDTSLPSPFAGRELLFFAVSYTDDAVRAAKERGIRLFTMDSSGVVTAV